jgi:hypothetical protein
MSYTINNTRGTTLANLQAGTTTNVGGITLIGKNYTGYGEIIAEDFVKMLENQASTGGVSPVGALTGQLWYDVDEGNLKVYDGTSWDRLFPSVGTAAPSSPTAGTTWLDTDDSTFNVYDGSAWQSVAVATQSLLAGSKTQSVQLESAGAWTGESADRVNGYSSGDPINVTAIIGKDDSGAEEVIAVFSPASFNVKSSANASTVTYTSVATDIYNNFSTTHANAGANSLTAGMNIRDTFLTDSEQASATGLVDNNNSSVSYTTDDIFILAKTTSQSHQGDLIPASNVSINLGSNTNRYNTIYGVSTSAQYADIAERFEADEPLDAGTVIALGGAKEITKTANRADETVFGVISDKPAFRMNDGAGDSTTHPFVAFSGRVLCKVKGPVAKGDRLVSSDVPGVAVKANSQDDWKATFGRALVDKTSEEVQKITIAIGVK